MFDFLRNLIFSRSQEALLWKEISEGIRSARGNNLFRGTATFIIKKQQIRLEILRSYPEKNLLPIILHVGNSLKETYFKDPFTNEVIFADKGTDLFIEQALSISRKGKKFICSSPEKATYK